LNWLKGIIYDLTNKMFYLSSLTKEICVYPKDLTSDIKELISLKIRELEGSVVGNHGYIISIVEFNQTSKGKIDNETGRVNYKIMYKAITFKPSVGEILDTFPIFINKHGFFCKVGHLQIFISQHMMQNWEYNPEENIWTKKEKENLKSKKKPESESGSESGSESESESESGSGSGSEPEPEQEIDQKNLVSVPTKIKIGDILRIKIIAFRINSNEITALAELT